VTGGRLAHPPGRAGRMWLERRLDVARRGADVLDRKLRILQAELDRRRAEVTQTGQDWDEQCADAERWLLRAALLGGQRAVRLAAGGRPADVQVRYAVTMGVRHPAIATVGPATGPVSWAGPVLVQARQAHQRALAAAVTHAATAAALRILEAEASATRYRLRAIKDRWIPRLEQARAEVMFALDEQERADGARLRLAAGTLSSDLAASHLRPGP
jgi:V/A-type H+/Na+-transporting ATPase subunit D